MTPNNVIGILGRKSTKPFDINFKEKNNPILHDKTKSNGLIFNWPQIKLMIENITKEITSNTSLE